MEKVKYWNIRPNNVLTPACEARKGNQPCNNLATEEHMITGRKYCKSCVEEIKAMSGKVFA